MPNVKSALARFVAKSRLKPYQLALCVLFVGWAPSLVLAYYSYSVLSRALEDKSMADAASLVRSLSKHVQNELDIAGETMDFYRTLPATLLAFQPPAAPAVPAPGAAGGSRRPPVPSPLAKFAGPAPQDWLASIFYPQKRIDSMFLVDPAGRVIAALPPAADPAALPGTFPVAEWKEATAASQETNYYLTPIHPRADKRLVTSLVVAVHDRGGGLLGYLGADILVERLSRRLQSIQVLSGADTSLEIIDQRNVSLFKPDLTPNVTGDSNLDFALANRFRARKSGAEEIGERLYVFSTIERTGGWLVVQRKASLSLHQPVRNLLRQTLFLAGLLIVGTAVTAYLLAGFYRQQLANTLRIAREKVFNEKILANMPVGIALVDPATEGFRQANDAFVEIIRSLGALGRREEIAGLTFAKLPVATRENLARVLHFGVPFQAVEQRFTAVNGQPRCLTTNLLRLQDSQQNTLGALCLIEDCTQAVALRQELLNASAAKDQFLAQLSHELRNPLSPVITMVAELETLTETQPDARLPLEIIRRNVQLEARLIDDLLDVTRISSGKLQLTRQAVDAHRIVRLALEICQREIDDKRLELRLELTAEEHWAWADPARLQQIFWNLIKNAVKFTPDGRRITVRSANLASGTADAKASQTHMDFLSPGLNGRRRSPARQSVTDSDPGLTQRDPAGRYLRVQIIDEGIGIEAANLGRIFNAFDQGQNSITRRFGGLGLGLAISKAMVAAHGGSLSVASDGAGRGSTFTVELETCAASAASVATPVSAAPAPAGKTTVADGNGSRILLVDDHEDTCLGMERLLKRRGYRVTTAGSVKSALARADQERFDLLVSDLGLPDGTGFDLMAALRRSGGPPGIALSGYGMESDLEKSREAGFSEHLIKPVDIERLDTAMRKLLRVGA